MLCLSRKLREKKDQEWVEADEERDASTAKQDSVSTLSVPRQQEDEEADEEEERIS